jgi:hypothetical protein
MLGEQRVTTRHATGEQDVLLAPPTATVPDRVSALALDIVHRLRPVCAHMPDAELLALATQVAAIELEHFETAAPVRPARRHFTRG